MKEEFRKRKTKTSANELLSDIAARICEITANDISEVKAKQGAMRFTQFCQKLIEIETRIESEKERKSEK